MCPAWAVINEGGICLIDKDYLKKVYSGFLGMNIGVRLGAPVESKVWTYERIKEVYGNIRGYIREYKNFAADDDVNGPVFFIRALYDDARGRELTAEDVGRAWLNYIRDGIGMLWWGGYGISTENTAYINLKNGIKPPRSGSAEQNGIILAEQIGGQIFIDTWGLVLPDNPEKAADYAEMAASVSHDKNGIYGARFIAACISKAFKTNDIYKIIETGLKNIPADCSYYKVVEAVLDFYEKNPEDFRLCRDYINKNWGYDKFGGVCPIIPNAGVCIMSMLYGKGSFSRAIEIAVMCGWDTDSNAGSLGTILGVANGINGIDGELRKPVNDFIVTSSISGYLNIIDAPSISKELALLGYRLSNEEPPVEIANSLKTGELYFDFSLPGSTHGFRLSNNNKFMISNKNRFGYKTKGCLEVLFDRITRDDSCRVYYKPFYKREDFDDERYSPVFSPKVYSGQNISMKVYLDKWEGKDINATPYVRKAFNKAILDLPAVNLKDNEWNDIEFVIPDTDGDVIDEAGIIVNTTADIKSRSSGRIYIDEFHVSGRSKYSIDFSKQSYEFGSVTPFSHNNGTWSIESGKMKCTSEGSCEAYTGNYYMKDFKIKAVIEPLSGYSHNIAFRAKGIKLGYHAGFDGINTVSLILNNFGFTRLITVPYKWKFKKRYTFEIEALGNNIRFSIDGRILIDFNDDTFDHGMFGFSKFDEGEAYISDVQVKEI